MNSDQTIAYVTRLPGVMGCCLSDELGEPIAVQLPPMYDEEMIRAMVMDGQNALETLRSEMPTTNELRIDTSTLSVLLRQMSSHLMIALVQDPQEIASIRIALNVAAKRYTPSPAATTPVPLGTGEPEALSQIPELEQTGGLFSLRRAKAKSQKPAPEKKEPPKKGGGSIWG